MLKRRMYHDLLEWRKNKDRECLMIKGARQTGKTYLVRQFGREYKSFIEINFLKNPELKGIFAESLTAEEIYKRMTASIPGIRLLPGDTLIFLDEIQKCAAARTAIKFLAEDNRYDVISSGSLLGLHYGQDIDSEVEPVESVPVGYERQLILYSLDFEEFLWAYGYEQDTLDYLRTFFENGDKVPDEVNARFENIFREHMVVGGMPEVVDDFMLNKDFSRVQNIQEKIMAAYDDDISMHAKGVEKNKVRACYRTIPAQLARENKKFKYSDVEKKATARKYESSIQWLHDANLVNLCYNLYEPYLPLMANTKENEFKVYFHDTGLLMSLYGMPSKLAILNNTMKGNAKGGIYENITAEMLMKKGYPLRYYKTPESTMELEFIIEQNDGVVPVEVKAGNTSTASMNNFIDKFDPSRAYKLIDGNVGVNGAKVSIPHYMALFL